MAFCGAFLLAFWVELFNGRSFGGGEGDGPVSAGEVLERKRPVARFKLSMEGVVFFFFGGPLGCFFFFLNEPLPVLNLLIRVFLNILGF